MSLIRKLQHHFRLRATLSGLLTATTLVSCQTPTKIIETPPAVTGQYDGGAPLVLDDKTVILDARSFFEYSSGHLPRSIHVQWDSFSRPGARTKGELDGDLLGLTKRLALWGIAPQTKVVVVGNGSSGQGEEGRVAWMLEWLGVSDVSIASITMFKQARVLTAPRPQAVALWKPKVDGTYMVIKAELKTKGEGVFLDVRTPDEFKQKPYPKFGNLNIFWKEFVDANGRPRGDVKLLLEKAGLRQDMKIIVVSENGVESASVAHVLRKLGYSKASNFASGLEEMRH